MNVIQRPRAQEFCATMQDYIIDTDETITFAVEYGGKKILEEDYSPDGQNRVRVRRLGRFCELALWGVWCAGESSWQPDAAGTFSFSINGVKDTDSFVMFSRMQTRKDASAPGVLSEVTQKVCRPGVPEYVSGMPPEDEDGFAVTGYDADGVAHTGTLAPSITVDTGGSTPGVQRVSPIATVEAGPDTVAELVGMDVSALARYTVEAQGGSLEFVADTSHYADLWVFRFKNVYDMPETLACTGGLTVAGSSEDDTAAMWGVERKFGLRVTDEYTARSGPIYLRNEYKLWHNLLNAQEAEIRTGDGEWLPIVITKQKLERDFRRSVLASVEFSFRMADATQNGLIE